MLGLRTKKTLKNFYCINDFTAKTNIFFHVPTYSVVLRAITIKTALYSIPLFKHIPFCSGVINNFQFNERER